jgi:hypothetical protein
MTHAELTDFRVVFAGVAATAGISGLTAAGVSGLTTASISGLTAAGVSGLTAAGVSGLTTAGIGGLTTAGISGRAAAGVSGLTAAGVSGLTTAGISRRAAALVAAATRISRRAATAVIAAALVFALTAGRAGERVAAACGEHKGQDNEDRGKQIPLVAVLSPHHLLLFVLDENYTVVALVVELSVFQSRTIFESGEALKGDPY